MRSETALSDAALSAQPVDAATGEAESSVATVSPRPDPALHRRSVTILHSSDIHIGGGYLAKRDGIEGDSGLIHLDYVVDLAHDQGADLLVITGDLFDHNRIVEDQAAQAGAILARAGIPVAILPGNHDPYLDESVYVRHAVKFPANVHILRRGEGELIALPETGVQIWGQAHDSYMNFAPVGAAAGWIETPEDPLWRVALAHGCYVRSIYETRLSYLIHPHELEGLQAHYVGLGHLERHEPIGTNGAIAYYAGAPERSGGATRIDLTPAGVEVNHVRFRHLRDQPAAPVETGNLIPSHATIG